MSKARKSTMFPEEQHILRQLGENIRLAMKRRKLTQTMLAERTGFSKPTLRNIERGESTVSIGHYVRVLSVLGLAADMAAVGADDVLGQKLQDIELLKSSSSHSANRDKATPPSSPDANSSASGRIQALLEKARQTAPVSDQEKPS